MTTGHRLVEHTADVRVEAWGPTRATALAEAVIALAQVYAVWAPDAGTTEVPVEVRAHSDAELLVAVLDEAVFLVDARGLVPVRADITDGTVTFVCVDVSDVDVTGPAPKGISWSDLVCAPEDGVWRCAVTVDV